MTRNGSRRGTLDAMTFSSQPRTGDGRFGEKIEVGMSRRLTEVLRESLGHDGTDNPPPPEPTMEELSTRLDVLLASPMPTVIPLDGVDTLGQAAIALGHDNVHDTAEALVGMGKAAPFHLLLDAQDHLALETKVAKWDPKLHPRDGDGQFISIGAILNLLGAVGGGRGTVVGNGPDNHVIIRKEDGTEVNVSAAQTYHDGGAIDVGKAGGKVGEVGKPGTFGKPAATPAAKPKPTPGAPPADPTAAPMGQSHAKPPSTSAGMQKYLREQAQAERRNGDGRSPRLQALEAASSVIGKDAGDPKDRGNGLANRAVSQEGNDSLSSMMDELDKIADELDAAGSKVKVAKDGPLLADYLRDYAQAFRDTGVGRTQVTADIAREANAPTWGSPYGGDGPAYDTPDGPVTMRRKGQKVRFYDADGNQVGPEQANVAPAAAYAADQGWTSPRLAAAGIVAPHAAAANEAPPASPQSIKFADDRSAEAWQYSQIAADGGDHWNAMETHRRAAKDQERVGNTEKAQQHREAQAAHKAEQNPTPPPPPERPKVGDIVTLTKPKKTGSITAVNDDGTVDVVYGTPRSGNRVVTVPDEAATPTGETQTPLVSPSVTPAAAYAQEQGWTSPRLDVQPKFEDRPPATPGSVPTFVQKGLSNVPRGPGDTMPPATGTRDDPIDVQGDVHAALDHLAAGRHVRLNQPDEVATLLDELRKVVADAKAKGEKAPIYDLCLVSVPDTNLFCAEHQGIKRINMPQLDGTPVPGTPAASMPKQENGNVDLTEHFIQALQDVGVSVTDKEVPASHLRASQRELEGSKVAGIAKAMEAGANPALDAPIFVTRDGYVIDGHHRWAAKVGLDVTDGTLGDVPMNVRVVDLDVGEALEFANAFTKRMGIQSQTADTQGLDLTPPSPGEFKDTEFSTANPELAAAATAAADELANKAVANEQDVTAILNDTVGAAGGRMEGLKYRFKERSTIRDKIARKAKETGTTVDEQAAKINDALRYTAIVGPGNYIGVANDVIAQLQAKGYEPTVIKNSWPKNDDYSGVNMTLQAPDGSLIELQFHTDDSWYTKNDTHDDYEIADNRTGTRTMKERRDAFARMAARWDTVEQPKGWEDFGTIKFNAPPTDAPNPPTDLVGKQVDALQARLDAATSDSLRASLQAQIDALTTNGQAT